MNKRNATRGSDALAVAVYVIAMREQIEKEQREKYEKRIDYLVGANNELMRELEVCEGEIITTEKGSIDFDFTASEEFRNKGESVVARLASVTEKKRES